MTESSVKLRLKSCRHCGTALNCAHCHPLRLAMRRYGHFDGQAYYDEHIRPHLKKSGELANRETGERGQQ